jgi:hypothetical protein
VEEAVGAYQLKKERQELSDWRPVLAVEGGWRASR